MAIQGHIELYNGVDMTSAYIVVSEIRIRKSEGGTNHADIYTAVYFDESIKNTNKPEVTTFIHRASGTNYTTYFDDTVLDDAGKTPFSQAYEFLKSLSQYNGFQDV